MSSYSLSSQQHLTSDHTFLKNTLLLVFMPPPFLICLLPLSPAFSVFFSYNLQKLNFRLSFLIYFATFVGALVESHALKYILYAPSSQIYLFSSEFSRVSDSCRQLSTLLSCLIDFSNFHCPTFCFYIIQLLSPLLPPLSNKTMPSLSQEIIIHSIPQAKT